MILSRHTVGVNGLHHNKLPGSTRAFLDESLMMTRELSLVVAEWITRYEFSDL